MKKLWPNDLPPAIGCPKDGERFGESREYRDRPGACRNCFMPMGAMRSNREIVRGPLTAIQGEWYCEDCYPKMVAILDADAKLEDLLSRDALMLKRAVEAGEDCKFAYHDALLECGQEKEAAKIRNDHISR